MTILMMISLMIGYVATLTHDMHDTQDTIQSTMNGGIKNMCSTVFQGISFEHTAHQRKVLYVCFGYFTASM